MTPLVTYNTLIVSSIRLPVGALVSSVTIILLVISGVNNLSLENSLDYEVSIDLSLGTFGFVFFS